MKYPSAFAAVLLALAGPASATEYLTNGGFETGDFSGWDLKNSPNAEDDIVASGAPFSASTMARNLVIGIWSISPRTLAFSLKSSPTLKGSS